MSELIIQNTQSIVNIDDTNAMTDEDFLHFETIENPETDELQNVLNKYSNLSP